MDKDGKIEERKRYNAPFLRAFNYLAGEKMMNQKQFAKVIDAESAYISALKAGTKRVGADYMARLAAAFMEHFKEGQHLNMDFLLGKSEYMILENVPDKEVLENINRGANPDYDVIQKAKAASPASAGPAANIPDMSSVFNAALAAKDETIVSLKRELSTKEDLIADLRARVKEKDDYIALLKARAEELQHHLSLISQRTDLEDYPFPVGVADKLQIRKNV